MGKWTYVRIQRLELHSPCRQLVLSLCVCCACAHALIPLLLRSTDEFSVLIRDLGVKIKGVRTAFTVAMHCRQPVIVKLVTEAFVYEHFLSKDRFLSIGVFESMLFDPNEKRVALRALVECVTDLTPEQIVTGVPAANFS